MTADRVTGLPAASNRPGTMGSAAGVAGLSTFGAAALSLPFVLAALSAAGLLSVAGFVGCWGTVATGFVVVCCGATGLLSCFAAAAGLLALSWAARFSPAAHAASSRASNSAMVLAVANACSRACRPDAA